MEALIAQTAERTFAGHVDKVLLDVGPNPGRNAAALIGGLSSHLTTLRKMFICVVGMLQAGTNPPTEAAW